MILNRLLQVLYGLLFLSVGFLAGYVWTSYEGGVTGAVIDVPSDYLNDDRIEVYSDRVVLNVSRVTLSNYADTGSMLPVLGPGVNGLSVVPNSEEEIDVGDIIIFRREEGLIVHRVIEKGIDENGVYFITKGDSSEVIDGKIRFEEIERVLIGIIY